MTKITNNTRLRYVANSYGNKPSFLIEMDGVEYISNGCVFTKNTKENIASIVDMFDCADEIKELLEAQWVSMADVVDARWMFKRCTSLTTFEADMPNVRYARCMFEGCKSLTNFEADMPNVKYTNGMFDGCTSLENQPVF